MDAEEKLRLEWENGIYDNAVSVQNDLALKKVYYRNLQSVQEPIPNIV